MYMYMYMYMQLHYTYSRVSLRDGGYVWVREEHGILVVFVEDRNCHGSGAVELHVLQTSQGRVIILTSYMYVHVRVYFE